MAYMDILPSANSNGKTIVLLHGRNAGSKVCHAVS